MTLLEYLVCLEDHDYRAIRHDTALRLDLKNGTPIVQNEVKLRARSVREKKYDDGLRTRL